MLEHKKEKLIRDLNLSRRRIQKQDLIFSEIGLVTNIFKSKDRHGNPERKKVKLNDKVVIFFKSKGRNFRGIIDFKDLCIGGSYPKYGQQYIFNSKSLRREYNEYTLIQLNSITSK